MALCAAVELASAEAIIEGVGLVEVVVPLAQPVLTRVTSTRVTRRGNIARQLDATTTAACTGRDAASRSTQLSCNVTDTSHGTIETQRLVAMLLWFRWLEGASNI